MSLGSVELRAIPSQTVPLATEVVTNVQEPRKINTGRLLLSRQPLMDALVYCALENHGIRLLENKDSIIKFQVESYPVVSSHIDEIISKPSTIRDPSYRITSLKKWFSGFPKPKIYSTQPFEIQILPKQVVKARRIIAMMTRHIKEIYFMESR